MTVGLKYFGFSSTTQERQTVVVLTITPKMCESVTALRAPALGIRYTLRGSFNENAEDNYFPVQNPFQKQQKITISTRTLNLYKSILNWYLDDYRIRIRFYTDCSTWTGINFQVDCRFRFRKSMIIGKRIVHDKIYHGFDKNHDFWLRRLGSRVACTTKIKKLDNDINFK